MSQDAQDNGEAPAAAGTVTDNVEEGSQAKKRKTNKPTTISQFTIRSPPWTYIQMTLLTSGSIPSTDVQDPAPEVSVDAISAHLHLQSALQQFLGLHGTTIPIDILKHEKQDVWVRVPREDGSAVVAAVGGWVGKGGEGWRVKGWNSWGPVVEGNGMDLFEEG